MGYTAKSVSALGVVKANLQTGTFLTISNQLVPTGTARTIFEADVDLTDISKLYYSATVAGANDGTLTFNYNATPDAKTITAGSNQNGSSDCSAYTSVTLKITAVTATAANTWSDVHIWSTKN
jgi:hypothetical protein